MAAALAAMLVGLLGVDGGILLVVVSVWTVRAIWGSSSGVAWGVACLGAALRWGTLGLGDVGAATRLVGPGIVAGQPVVVAGMALALVAAVVSEARQDGLRASSAPERAAAMAALVALVALFLAPGPGHPDVVTSLLWWVGAATGLVAATMLLHRPARAIPVWATGGLAACGVVVTGLSS